MDEPDSFRKAKRDREKERSFVLYRLLNYFIFRGLVFVLLDKQVSIDLNAFIA